MFCVDVVDLGMNVEQFQGQPPKEVHKIALVFASGESQREAGKPDELKLVTVEMTLSAAETSNLRKFLQNWRGRDYTAEEAARGLPITKLYGQAALISIQHVTTKRGNLFAKITSIAQLPKQMALPSEDAARLLAEYTRPKFLNDKKAAYAAAVAAHRAAHGEPGPLEDDTVDDDLPF